jgi:molybdate transport system substrate-binding protein
MPLEPSDVQVSVLSSMATREILAELIDQFARQTGRQVRAESAGGVDVMKRLQAGEAVDLIVLAQASIDQLVLEGKAVADHRIDFADSGIGAAVKSGARRPDLTTAAALKQALLAARSVGYSTGPSGSYLLKMFESLGVYGQIKARIVQAPAGVPVGKLIADGSVELGFQQISELISAPGIDLLGPLPGELQSITTFSAAATPAARNKAATNELLVFLNSAQADTVKRRFGMEPVRRPV